METIEQRKSGHAEEIAAHERQIAEINTVLQKAEDLRAQAEALAKRRGFTLDELRALHLKNGVEAVGARLRMMHTHHGAHASHTKRRKTKLAI